MVEITQKKCIQILSTTDGNNVGKFVSGFDCLHVQTRGDFENAIWFDTSDDLQEFVKNYMTHEESTVINYYERTFYNIKK